MAFTLIFEGDIRDFKANPLKTETPFGVPYAAGIGDSFEEGDIFREALEAIVDGSGDPAEIAAKAFEDSEALKP